MSGSPICLIITDNATSMLSVQKKAGGVEVRLHRMFLHAGPEICHEVAELIRKGRCRRQIIRSFIRQNSHLLRQKAPVRATQRSAGQHYCLKTIYESLNKEYFEAKYLCFHNLGAKSFTAAGEDEDPWQLSCRYQCDQDKSSSRQENSSFLFSRIYRLSRDAPCLARHTNQKWPAVNSFKGFPDA